MATAIEVIGALHSRGITLEPDGAGGLRVNGISRLTDREKAALKAHKAAILKALAADSAVSTGPASLVSVEASTAVTEALPTHTAPPADIRPLVPRVDADRQEAFEERAGIMEYDGGLVQQDAERKAAAANRLAMPIIAGVVNEFRQAFGADQVRVTYAEEAGTKLGTPPPPGVKPVLAGDKVPMPSSGRQEDAALVAECRTCLRYDPRVRYCGHKLRVIRQGDGVICAGTGYASKGEPWKGVAS